MDISFGIETLRSYLKYGICVRKASSVYQNIIWLILYAHKSCYAHQLHIEILVEDKHSTELHEHSPIEHMWRNPYCKVQKSVKIPKQIPDTKKNRRAFNFVRIRVRFLEYLSYLICTDFHNGFVQTSTSNCHGFFSYPMQKNESQSILPKRIECLDRSGFIRIWGIDLFVCWVVSLFAFSYEGFSFLRSAFHFLFSGYSSVFILPVCMGVSFFFLFF